MSQSEQSYGADEEVFSLTVDQYGRLWLNAKLDGIPVSIDLASKDAAFGIMAGAMAEHGYDDHTARRHEPADNDDQPAEKG